MEENLTQLLPTIFIQLSQHQWPFHIQQFILCSVGGPFKNSRPLSSGILFVNNSVSGLLDTDAIIRSVVSGFGADMVYKIYLLLEITGPK